MKIRLFLSYLLFLSFTGNAQINLQDSTVQTIGFWDKKETQSYTVTADKYKVKGGDTTDREITQYDVVMTILDSTAKSYTVEWVYKNVKTNSDDPVVKRYAVLSNDMKVVIKTDEMGSFQEVVNWKELKDFVKKTSVKLKSEFKDLPNINDITKNIESLYASREAIEASCIDEIHQYYTFHGVKYQLGQPVEARIKVPNFYGGEPFDADFVMMLDEINAEDENYILRSNQAINKKQLADATHKFLVEYAKEAGIKAPKRTDLNGLSSEIDIAARIHDSGWVIYSVQTETTKAVDLTTIEECTIEIK